MEYNDFEQFEDLRDDNISASQERKVDEEERQNREE